ncbi:hypothetical protein E2C01_011261 [Portunus trituberculatus]|uniref:Secreted protein n=1 Tax=Portunus trituberculatus TaxID=210409 RepID=A0A5B7DAM0_PORTR|nr:hypothetical protein [Portunus trituberculatus]
MWFVPALSLILLSTHQHKADCKCNIHSTFLHQLASFYLLVSNNNQISTLCNNCKHNTAATTELEPEPLTTHHLCSNVVHVPPLDKISSTEESTGRLE